MAMLIKIRTPAVIYAAWEVRPGLDKFQMDSCERYTSVKGFSNLDHRRNSDLKL